MQEHGPSLFTKPKDDTWRTHSSYFAIDPEAPFRAGTCFLSIYRYQQGHKVCALSVRYDEQTLTFVILARYHTASRSVRKPFVHGCWSPISRGYSAISTFLNGFILCHSSSTISASPGHYVYINEPEQSVPFLSELGRDSANLANDIPRHLRNLKALRPSPSGSEHLISMV